MDNAWRGIVACDPPKWFPWVDLDLAAESARDAAAIQMEMVRLNYFAGK